MAVCIQAVMIFFALVNESTGGCLMFINTDQLVFRKNLLIPFFLY